MIESIEFVELAVAIATHLRFYQQSVINTRFSEWRNMSDPFSFVLKLQLSLFKQWYELTSSILQLCAPEPPPIPVRVVVKTPGTSLVPPGHPTSRMPH